MSVCPFCKAQVPTSTAPCPRCGKLASDHPSIAAIGGRTLSTDFDEDDHGALDIEATGHAGSSSKQHAGMPFEGGKGLTLDDDLFGDSAAAGPLELDVPDLPVPPPSSRKPMPAPPPSDPSMRPAPAAPAPSRGSDPRMAPSPAPPPAASSSGRLPAAPASVDSAPGLPVQEAPPSEPQPPSVEEQAAARIANYPAPPEKIWFAPRYAVQVFLRRFELRQDLDALRRKRSPDVKLYERALQAHDPKMYKAGLAITGAAIFIAMLLFFMPVIKRFAFAPD